MLQFHVWVKVALGRIKGLTSTPSYPRRAKVQCNSLQKETKLNFKEGLNGGVALTVDGKILPIFTVDG